MKTEVIKAFLVLLAPYFLVLLFVVFWRWHKGYNPLGVADLLLLFQLPITTAVGLAVMYSVRETAKVSPDGRLLEYAFSVKLLMVVCFTGILVILLDAFHDPRVARMSVWGTFLFVFAIMVGVLAELLSRKVWFDDRSISTYSIWRGRTTMEWEEVTSACVNADVDFRVLGTTFHIGTLDTAIRAPGKTIWISSMMNGDMELLDELIVRSESGFELQLRSDKI